MRHRLILSLIPIAAVLTAQPSSQARSSSKLPSTVPVFSLENMDLKANPCADFYQYACGTWLAENPIPADQSRWGRYNGMEERNLAILRNILEKAAVPDPTRDAVSQKIGDFYASCMDERSINRQGAQPIQAELKRIDAIANKSAIANEIPGLQRKGVNVFFRFNRTPDAKNSQQNIAQADQGGLGLFDRDDYLKDDERSAALRNQYVAHVRKMFELIGDAPLKAAANAKAVLTVETELARGSQDRLARRDPAATYHKLTVSELSKLAPFMDWPKYFQAVGAPPFETLNVAAPGFFHQLDSTIAGNRLDDLKAYMRWQVIRAEAALLAAPIADEDFNFYGGVLNGATENRPRWKRCIDLVDSDLGYALGEKYAAETFGAGGKRRALEMVRSIEKALGEDLLNLDWMSAETKKQALIKLSAITNKIGYPDRWRDYSSVKIVRGNAVGNDFRATEFGMDRRLKQIGQPVDRAEWSMTPFTINADYSPTANNINFPAGILQPPFYDNQADAALNYGAIGSIIGHELIHGFDDEGRRYDASGNLRDWWKAEDAEEFQKRAQCFIDEYSAFEAVERTHLDGKLTLGENTADNGGVRIALMALRRAIADEPQSKVDGFTPEQRFFLAWGQISCQNTRPEAARLGAQTDPHSPGRYRVNGVVSNMPEFQRAFACKLGEPMVREPACRIW